jgi:hypothetical protein
VHRDEPVLVEEHQIEAGRIAHTLTVVFSFGPFHVNWNLEYSQVFSGSSMKKKNS